jgi:hypothetical protein
MHKLGLLRAYRQRLFNHGERLDEGMKEKGRRTNYIDLYKRKKVGSLSFHLLCIDTG